MVISLNLTDKDIQAMKSCSFHKMNDEEYMEFLRVVNKDAPEFHLRQRKGPKGEPFEL